MEETPDQTTGRLVLAATPSLDDLNRAATIPADQCPRRYCWWWHSLSFDWELTPSEGCTFLTAPKPSGSTNPGDSCCRYDSTSAVDQYESREPHLLDDGFAVPRWHSSAHRRPNGEISYDLVMDDDMVFVEESYRIGGCEWRVVIVSKRPIVTPSWKPCTWDSGVSGIVVEISVGIRLNALVLENLLAEILGVGAWERVQGPDSMQLR